MCIKGPESWWIAKSITPQLVVNQSTTPSGGFGLTLDWFTTREIVVDFAIHQLSDPLIPTMIETGDKTKLQLHIMRLHQMLAQTKKSIIIVSLIWNNRAKPHLFLLNLEGRHENYLMKTNDFLTVRKCFHCALSEFVCQIWLRGTTQVLTLLSTYDSTSTYTNAIMVPKPL